MAICHLVGNNRPGSGLPTAHSTMSHRRHRLPRTGTAAAGRAQALRLWLWSLSCRSCCSFWWLSAVWPRPMSPSPPTCLRPKPSGCSRPVSSARGSMTGRATCCTRSWIPAAEGASWCPTSRFHPTSSTPRLPPRTSASGNILGWIRSPSSALCGTMCRNGRLFPGSAPFRSR